MLTTPRRFRPVVTSRMLHLGTRAHFASKRELRCIHAAVISGHHRGMCTPQERQIRHLSLTRLEDEFF